jgi:hypothetical protein
MADIQGKHSVPRAQDRRHRANVSTKPAVKTRKRNLPLLPPPFITRRGKTTTRRYANRSFHRLEEVNGKTVDFVEFYTSSDYHAIDVRFQDKTALHIVIDPRFTLDTEYTDWKTGNGRAIKRWPLVHSQTFRA